MAGRQYSNVYPVEDLLNFFSDIFLFYNYSFHCLNSLSLHYSKFEQLRKKLSQISNRAKMNSTEIFSLANYFISSLISNSRVMIIKKAP